MANNPPEKLYQGHSIFRNQPHYTYYNKSFEDPTDALYLGLNEIDAFFLQEEQLQNDAGFEHNTIKDPRTQQAVPEVCYDHTCKPKSKIFRCGGVKSSLTKAEHVICVRVLQAWQEEQEVKEADILVWRRVERQRLKEKQQMLKFIYDNAQTQREAMYAPAKQLLELYGNWYGRMTERLLSIYKEDVAYNTHTGLPHVRICKKDSDSIVEIKNVELLARQGYVPVWHEQLSTLDYQKLQHKLQTYSEIYNEALPEQLVLLEEAIETQLHESSPAGERSRVLLPLDALLLLLTVGDYVDLPTEVLLEIHQDVEEETKVMKFEEPLPARNCGWHTHKQVVEQGYEAYLSTLGDLTWLRLDNAAVSVAPLMVETEIVAFVDEASEFKPLKFEQYLQKYQANYKPDQTSLKHNAALIKWQLQAAEAIEDDAIEILTSLQLPPTLNADASKFQGSHCFKLEYKPTFGCEIMTKHELLREWLRLKLLSDCQVTEVGKCLRLDVGTFETQLEEPLTLLRLEQKLADIYHIRMPQLLTNLAEFLKLLLCMPAGKYMLRYNPKFKDKLMLCTPTQDITQNTVFLHALLKAEPTDLLFMTQPHFLPIADDLISIVHVQHKVLPCAFLPLLSHQKKKRAKLSKQSPKNVNDREHILKRVQHKDELHKQQVKQQQKKKKAAQNARKRKRVKLEKAKEQQQQKEALELQQEIEMDNKFFAYTIK